MLTLTSVNIIDDGRAVLGFVDHLNQTASKLYEKEDGKWSGWPPEELKKQAIGKPFGGTITNFGGVQLVTLSHEQH